MLPSREELLAEFETSLLSIKDGNALIEAVTAVQERRPWDMGYRSVALRVAAKRGPALVAVIEEGWPEVEDKGPPSKEAAKKISPPAQPSAAIPPESQPKGPKAQPAPSKEPSAAPPSVAKKPVAQPAPLPAKALQLAELVKSLGPKANEFDIDEKAYVPQPTLRNTMLAVRDIGLICSHNVFQGQNYVQTSEGLQELSDDLCVMVRQKILAEYEFDPKKENVRDAMHGMCLENRFNPVVEWLDGLEWDGEPRLDRWLIRYCGVEDTPLNRAIGWKFLCGAVRRAKQPGCKFDHALILEGKQKIGKSTVVEILASGPGDGYYTDAEGKKEQQELVKGIWFYELSELTGIRKADAQSVLHFISRKKERGRMAYAHFVTTDLRSVVFVGTTNDQEYLVAQDGNRRFWSVWCNPVVGSKLDTDGLRRDLGQLFAEAVVVEPEEALWIGDDLWTEAEALQESRRVKHPWEDTLAALCYTVANGPKKAALPDGKKEWRIHTETIYESHLKIPVAHRTDGDHKRLSSIMQRHGWEKKSSLRIGQVVRAGYVKEVEETAV